MKENIINYNGINYQKPNVFLINESGLGAAELAARTCYDSFDFSENEDIKNFNSNPTSRKIEIESSDLLDSLAWVHHHHSIIEHISLTYLIKGVSRAVLQEHARHRIQSISVRSTRYTMQNIIYAYLSNEYHYNNFENIIKSLDIFNLEDDFLIEEEIKRMFEMLNKHKIKSKDNFLEYGLTKANIELYNSDYFKKLDNFMKYEEFKKNKSKRNVGDSFKYLVTDNWKTDLVVTFNLRSLKNYFDLRDSGAAWFQIQELAKAMKEVTPLKYLRLIDKKYKNLN